MKIAVNTRFLIKDKLEGIGVFTYETFKRITHSHPEHQFYFLFDRPYDPEFIFSENITPISISPPARHPILWYLWFEISLPRVLKKIKPDIFISTDGYLSLKTKTKSLSVIHDLAFEHYPEDVPFLVSKYYRHYFPKFAKKADRIVTVSSYSKKDIILQYKINPDMIDVVFNGAGEIFRPTLENENYETKKEFTKGSEFFVYVGALHSRKNIDHLLLAFDIFKTKSQTDFKLVIIGRSAWKTKKMYETYNSMKYKEDVIFTGRIATSKLSRILGAASALTYVSYFEGFGIPLLEAMYSDVPVITSNTGSLMEVAGDSALLCDPNDAEDIANKMIDIAKYPKLRQNLIQKERIQRTKYSWDKTAELFWESILKTLSK